MKKLIILFIGMCLAFAIHAQTATTIVATAAWITANTITLNGAVADTIDFPRVAGEYDPSIQLIPAQVGSGDSLHFSFITYLSAAYTGDVWSAIQTADTVSTITDADGITWWADLKPLRIRMICLKIGADSITITPYYVYKKHENE